MKKIWLKRKPPINTLMFSCYILIMIYAYVNTNRAINELFTLMTIMIIGDSICFFMAIKQLRIKIKSDEIVEKNTLFTVIIDLKNQGFLPMPSMEIVLKEGLRARLEERNNIGLMLVGKEHVEQVISYKAKLCGLEEIGIEKIIFRSLFAFFKKEITSSTKVRIKILPEIRLLENMQSFTDFIGEIEIREGKQKSGLSSGVEEELGYELRPYIEGDSQRLIHWKIAAYKDEWLVRKREHNSEKKADVFLILNPFVSKEGEVEEARMQDKLLTTFISLVGYYLNKEYDVSLAYYEEQSWVYLKVKDSLQLKKLQNQLGDYVCLSEENVNGQDIIEGILTITKQRNGTKVLISNYWTNEMGEYIFDKEKVRTLPCIWTDDNLPEEIEKVPSLAIWYMTNQYEIQLLDKNM